ncbi:MAG: 3-mercaptopyruvate sulfurtransferase [Gemmatimonadota bacterium]
MRDLSLPGPVVPAAWLAPRLHEPGLVVLDASWYLPGSGRDARAEYRAGHLPGARFFDLDAASDPASPLPHMLPPADHFAGCVSALGISDGDRVVIYDGSGTNLSAPRVWWMFRVFGHGEVAVLDGGLKAWIAEGRPLESGEPAPARAGRFRARFDPSAVRDLAFMRENLHRRVAQVVDLRAAGRFLGIEPEPRPGLPSGHIPGSRNVPFTELVQPDGTVLPPDQLRARLERAGIDLNRPVVASCGSGTSACALALNLARLGIDAAVYDGSWTEWAQAGGPIETGTGETNASGG